MWEQIQHFHFLRPELLLLVVPLLLLLIFAKNTRAKSGLWGRVCDERLLPFLLVGKNQQNNKWSFLTLAIIGLAIILAFAGPAWKKLPQPVFRSQAALIIALDLSRSMDVTDVKPSRLARARHKIQDILKKRQDGQSALIVYAAEAFVVTPLTEDSKTVAALAKNLSSDLMPFQGSYPEKAIEKSLELFKQASAVNGHVLLLTDGIESDGMTDAIAKLTSEGYRLSILGVGTDDGAPIADYRGGFVKDKEGSIVIARLDESQLVSLARQGGGVYQSLSANDSDINSILNAISEWHLEQQLGEEEKDLKLKSDQWREEGPWILLLLLPFIALAFRKGYLVLLVAVLLPLPQNSYAFDWSSLWKNEDQRAKSALEAGEHKRAAELFSDREWKAAANYRAENYQKTIDELKSLDNPEAYYNSGNAYARLGQLQEAIKAYDQALEKDPAHDDAKYNRDLLQEYLDKNQQDQDNQESSQNSDKNDQSDNNKDQQNSQEKNQSNNEQGKDGNQQDQNNSSEDSQDNVAESENQPNEEKEQQAQNNTSDKDSDNESLNEQNQAQQSQDAEQDDEQNKNSSKLANKQLSDEERARAQKTEQWLRRIPDDPGGLLRRKFRYQSELDSHKARKETRPW